MVVTFGVRLPRSISNVRTASAHAAMTARIADARNAVFSGARENGHSGGSFHPINALPLNGWHVNQWRFASQGPLGPREQRLFSLVQKNRLNWQPERQCPRCEDAALEAPAGQSGSNWRGFGPPKPLRNSTHCNASLVAYFVTYLSGSAPVASGTRRCRQRRRLSA
jgi:hypothetical protein